MRLDAGAVLLAITLAILFLIGIALILWQLQRLHAAVAKNADRDSNTKIGAESTQEQKALQTQKKQFQFLEEPLVVRSPLEGLSFSAALTLTPVWDGIQRSSDQLLRSQFAAHIGDGVLAGSGAVRFIQSTGEYVIEFSERGRELLNVGKATLMKSKETGRMIPKLVGLDRKIIETGREVGKLKSIAGKLASLSSIVVGAAHIVSGADVAKKIGQVARDVKFLMDARQNSQMAKLESIYHSAQQILAAPLTEHAQWELRRQMREIAKLRATWRRDLESKLRRVNDPNNAGFFQHYFRTQYSKDKQVAGGISECQEDLMFVEITLVTQIALAQSRRDLDVLLTNALPSELNLLRQTSQLLAEKAAFISGKHPDLHVEPMIAGIDDLINRMSALTSENKISQVPAANYASS